MIAIRKEKIMNIIKRFLKLLMRSRPVYIEETYVNENKLLCNKRALVIGGGTGIGLAISKRLSQAGAEVIIASRTIREISNDNYSYVEWDVSDTLNIKKTFNDLVNTYGPIDIVVNSQGICPNADFTKRISDVDILDYDLVMNTNLKSVYFICQCACDYFKKSKIRGHILNIASTDGLKGSVVPYGISKAGVISLTKGFGKQMAKDNIIINAIAPGGTRTSMINLDKNDNLTSVSSPSGRISTPEEIANIALMLVSDMGNNMPGSIVTVDGGESLH